MNKAAIIAIVVVALGAVGAGGYWLWSNNFSDTALAHQAFSGDGAVTCTFVDPETEQEGTMYALDGDIRIDGPVEGGFMEVDADSEETVQAHMLMQDNTMYMWADGESEGMQFSYEEDEVDEFTGEDDVPFADYEDEAELEREFEEQQVDCSRGADADLFEVPDDVNFIDPSQMFEAMMQESFQDLEDYESDSAEAEAELDEAMEQLEQLEQ